MKGWELKNLLENKLGIESNKLGELLNISDSDVNDIILGNKEIDGDMALMIYKVKNDYEIPRIKTDDVKFILSSDKLTPLEKADKIKSIDYNCSCRETDRRVDKSKLMGLDNIKRNIENRDREGLNSYE